MYKSIHVIRSFTNNPTVRSITSGPVCNLNIAVNGTPKGAPAPGGFVP